MRSSPGLSFLLIFFVHLILLGFKLDILSLEPPLKKQRPLKIQIQKEHVFKGRQIVQSEDGPSADDRPLDDAFLGNKTRYFDRETQSSNIGIFKEGGRKKMTLSDIGAYKKNYDPMKVAAKKFQQKLNGSKTSVPDERGESASSDHLLNIPLGDFTHLNTVEYKYYGFYQRVRQKLEQFWGRSIQEKAEILMRMGRAILPDDEHITSLEITLSAVGEIIEIVIRGSSGVKELDDAAIESFNEAGPFPNPPRGLVRDGKLTIEWGFVVKT